MPYEVKPEQIPFRHKEEFIQGHWTSAYINKLAAEPGEPEDYPGALQDLANCALAAARVAPTYVEEGSALVVGSVSPWIECWLLHHGVHLVYTTDVNPIQIDAADVVFLPQTELAGRQFNVIVAYSTVEHVGLGRYGDELDEDGDLKCVRQLYDVLVPGGLLLLAVPVAEEYQLVAPWHRIYGPERLARLTAGFKLLASSKLGQISNSIDFKPNSRYEHDWQNQPVLALQKPTANT